MGKRKPRNSSLLRESIRVPPVGTEKTSNCSTSRNSSGTKIRFARTPEDVLHDGELSANARVVYGELALWIFKGQSVKMGQRQIAKNLKFRLATVCEALKELCERGHIKVLEGEGKRRRRYHLNSGLFDATAENEVVSRPRRKKKESIPEFVVDDVAFKVEDGVMYKRLA